MEEDSYIYKKSKLPMMIEVYRVSGGIKLWTFKLKG